MGQTECRAQESGAEEGIWRVDRRDFLRLAAGTLLSLPLGCGFFLTPEEMASGPKPRFGIVTDAHYADADTKGTRFYRESIAKMREAVGRLRREKLDFAITLGDLKDMAPGESEERTLSHLIAIEKEFQGFGGPTYHVLGNHDLDNLSKQQFLANVVNTDIPEPRPYYAFYRSSIHYIVLDACYRRDGVAYDHGDFDSKNTFIPPEELDGLRDELAASSRPAIVFVHQRLDGDGSVQVMNREMVRRVLEESGKVLAVFQGHDHQGAYSLINGIHYYTLKAMVDGSGPENNAYAVVEIHPNLNISVTGYRKAVSMEMNRPRTAQPQEPIEVIEEYLNPSGTPAGAGGNAGQESN